MKPLRAPFPWFGGKSKVAHLVWARFGNVSNYVEPFFGSGAVLLGRPHQARIETVNDLDCYLANFWRAVQLAPAEVARYADAPVNEADLHARHLWLVKQADFRERMKTDPEYFDAKIAGWWVWGLCSWIGSGWCALPEWAGRINAAHALRGINCAAQERNTRSAGQEVWKKRPELKRSARGVLAHGVADAPVKGKTRGAPGDHRRPQLGVANGVHKRSLSQQVPDLGGNDGAAGRGILASGLKTVRQIPDLSGDGSSGRGLNSPTKAGAIEQWMLSLCERLRRVRVCCGDWKRVLGRSVTECIGTTALFLDPPYGDVGRDVGLYVDDSLTLAGDVRQWAIDNGGNPLLRIALCGYEGEHELPGGWTCVAWKANGGHGNKGGSRGKANAHRERIWFSPHCLEVERQSELAL